MPDNQERRELQVAAFQSSTHNNRHYDNSSNGADPFNDPSGVIYRAKRSYLRSRGEAAIEPPDQFKTRRQMRLKKIRGDGCGGALNDAASFAFLNVLKKEDDIMRNPYLKKNKTNHVAKEHKFLRNMLVICKYTSDSALDWIEERQAGCRIWVNRNTGEVTSECPFAKEGGGGGGGSSVKRDLWRSLGARGRGGGSGGDGSGGLSPMNARPSSRAKTPVAETPRGRYMYMYLTYDAKCYYFCDFDLTLLP